MWATSALLHKQTVSHCTAPTVCPHHFKSSSCMHKTHAAPVRRKYFLLLQIFFFKFIYSNIFFASSESSIPQKTWTKLCWLSTNPANQSQYVKAIQPGNAKTICKQLHGLCLLVCCICYYFICCIFNFICYLGGGWLATAEYKYRAKQVEEKKKITDTSGRMQVLLASSLH